MTGVVLGRRLEVRKSGHQRVSSFGTTKRRCRLGTGGLSRRDSCSRSLVPAAMIRAMAVESALSLDVGQLIRRFAEAPKARSETDLIRGSNSSSKDWVAEQQKLERKLGRLTAENEQLKNKLGDVSLKIRDLERQLNYERAFYQEQKSCYVNAMKWRKETRHVKTQTYAVDFTYDSDQVTTLVSELRAVRELYLKQKQLTTSVCEKYVKMRESKEAVIRRMARMEEHYQETIQEAMTNFDRDRVAFALLEKDGVLPREMHSDLANRCSKLAFNNAALHAALLKIKSARLQRSSKDLLGDVSIYSILKETKDLAMIDSRLKKTKRWKKREDVEVEQTDRTGKRLLGKFVSLPVLVNEGGRSSCKITPLFEIENDEEVSEEEEVDSNGEIEEVEVDCSYRRRRKVCFSSSSVARSSESFDYQSKSQESLPYSVRSGITLGETSSRGMTASSNGKAPRCESEVDVKEKPPRPPRTGSAPDIIQATF